MFMVKEDLKRRIPWFVKIPAKIVLARLPIPPRTWQRLNVFRAGGMDNPSYGFEIFQKHFAALGRDTLHGCTVLELGPGNSVLTALYARSLGAQRTWLVDSESLASQDITILAQAERDLSERRLSVPGVGTSTSISEALDKLNATYLTDGLKSLQSVPGAEVDFMFSNAVLEHISLAEFAKLAKEMRRVLKPNGAASHVIDFRDHLQNGLNNLRFSEKLWESRFMARSGFYTNRLTWPAMRNIFQDAGFLVGLLSHQLWPNGIPTAQDKMATPFRNMPPSDFGVMTAHVLLRPAGLSRTGDSEDNPRLKFCSMRGTSQQNG